MTGDDGTHKKADRIDYARRLLQKNFLPHIGLEMGANSAIKKSFYLGYMVHKLLNCSLGRSEQEDRDHISNKRMDLAGPMIARLFHGLLYRFTKELMAYMKKTLESRRGSGFVNLATGAKVEVHQYTHAEHHHHQRPAVFLRHRQLGRPLARTPHVAGRVAGAGPPGLLLVAVGPAAGGGHGGHGEQGDEAASAAQHAVGHDVSCGDA